MDLLKPPPPLKIAAASNIKQAYKDWKQKFELYFMASGADKKLSPEQKKHYCCILLGMMGWIYMSPPPSNESFIRHVFFSRKQKDGETYDEFITDLKKLSSECNFENLKDGLIRDQIIIGIQDSKLKENLLKITDLTLEKCISSCRVAETAKKQIENLKKDDTEVIAKINKWSSSKLEPKPRDQGGSQTNWRSPRKQQKPSEPSTSR